MQDITKNFYGYKLKFARQYRGLSMEELGERIGKSKQIISQYETENDPQVPSFNVVVDISEKLKFPISFFYTNQDIKMKEVNTYFRSLISSNKKDKTIQKLKATSIICIHKLLEKYIEFPKLNIPRFDPKDLEEKNYYNIVKTLRKEWDLDDKPINNIINILEKNGFILSSADIGTDDIDAFTHYVEYENNQFFCIVLGKEKKSFARRQFNAAHELAHVILHGTYIDMSTISREEFRKIEREADKFAAEFLLPRDEFKADLIYPTNLKFYENLKKKWKVSILAMLMRAADLNVITKNQLQYLIKQAYFKGYRKKEPLDDTLKMYEPTLIPMAINMILDNNICMPNEIIEQLKNVGVGFYSDEIEDLIGLERGKLSVNSKDTDNVIKINFKKKY